MRKISRYAIRKKEVIFQLEVIKVSLRGLADSEFQAIYGTKRKRHAPALQVAVSSKAFFCVGCDKSKGLNKQRLTVSKDNKKPGTGDGASFNCAANAKKTIQIANLIMQQQFRQMHSGPKSSQTICFTKNFQKFYKT